MISSQLETCTIFHLWGNLICSLFSKMTLRRKSFIWTLAFLFYCSSIYSILVTLKARQSSFQNKRHVALLLDISCTVSWHKKKKKKKIILIYKGEKRKAKQGWTVWLADSSDVDEEWGLGLQFLVRLYHIFPRHLQTFRETTTMFSSEKGLHKGKMCFSLNTTQALEKKRKIVRVIWNKCASGISSLDGIFRVVGGRPRIYLHLKMLSPKGQQ